MVYWCDEHVLDHTNNNIIIIMFLQVLGSMTGTITGKDHL